MFNIPVTKQQISSAPSLKRKILGVKPVQSTGGLAVTLTFGSAIMDPGEKRQIGTILIVKTLEMLVEKSSRTQESNSIFTRFQFFRLVEAAVSCCVRTLAVQKQIAEVAVERVAHRHQAERAAVAAYLSGEQTGGGLKVNPGRETNAKTLTGWEDNLGEFGFPGFSVKERDLTGALSLGHDDTVVAEKLFFGC